MPLPFSEQQSTSTRVILFDQSQRNSNQQNSSSLLTKKSSETVWSEVVAELRSATSRSGRCCSSSSIEKTRPLAISTWPCTAANAVPLVRTASTTSTVEARDSPWTSWTKPAKNTQAASSVSAKRMEMSAAPAHATNYD